MSTYDPAAPYVAIIRPGWLGEQGGTRFALYIHRAEGVPIPLDVPEMDVGETITTALAAARHLRSLPYMAPMRDCPVWDLTGPLPVCLIPGG